MRFAVALCLSLAACISPIKNLRPDVRFQATGEQTDWGIEIKDFSEDDLPPAQKKFDERVEAGDKHIVFVINSFGGAVFQGWDFIKHVEDAKKKFGFTTTCIVDVKAYSMGYVMLQSGACDDRKMTTRATLLAHEGSLTLDGPMKADEIESEAQFLQALNNTIIQVCSARMGMPAAEFAAKIHGKDWTMTPDTAITVHAVDFVVDPAAVPPLYTLEVEKKNFLQKLFGG
jgi:ATP-dependent protease ClpP protease subunit